MMWAQLEMQREKAEELLFMNAHHLFGYRGYHRDIAAEDCRVSVVDAIEYPRCILLGTVDAHGGCCTVLMCTCGRHHWVLWIPKVSTGKWYQVPTVSTTGYC